MPTRRGRVLPTQNRWHGVCDSQQRKGAARRHRWGWLFLNSTVGLPQQTLRFTSSFVREPYFNQTVTFTSAFTSLADGGLQQAVKFRSSFVADTGLLATGRFRD